MNPPTHLFAPAHPRTPSHLRISSHPRPPSHLLAGAPALLCRLLILAALAAPAAAQPVLAQPPQDRVAGLVAQLESALTDGTAEALTPLLAADRDAAAVARFAASWLAPGVTRVVVKERDRVALPGGGTRLVLEAFVETGHRARLGTWQLDAREEPAAWRITSLKTLGFIDGLHRLQLDATRRFRASNLRVTAEDLELVLPNGSVFAADVPGGFTAVVLVGRGEMIFSPSPEVERGQVQLYAGSPTLRTPFDTAFVRLNPGEFTARFSEGALAPAAPDPRQLRTAQTVFRESVGNSFSVDLADLSPEFWSLVPSGGDFLAEVRTRRFGTLTYTRSATEPEDISLFNRSRRRNVSVYASKARLQSRGPFFHEDDEQPFDILDYNVDASLTPDRQWVDARARLRVRVREASGAFSMNLKLAGTVTVRSVSTESGPLLFLRVRNQDSLVVNLPGVVAHGAVFTVTVSYAGRVEPQSLDQEVIAPQVVQDDRPLVEPEGSLLYSNRGYWYPQTSVSDYATATIRLTLPTAFGAVCSGDQAGGSPVAIKNAAGQPRALFVFAAAQPVRYLACVVSRLLPVDTRTLAIRRPAGPPASATGARYSELALTAYATARQRARARELLGRTEDIAAVYAGILHDAPYPGFALAVLESYVPGGHSPAYFAAFNQPLPTSPFSWRDDPASFDNYPEFFLAHELAHQWWGQAVGWKNYHEQWLSEGFAQYFAAIYAERRRGAGVFDGIIRTMSRWAVSTSDQGAVYLGYRLGHVKNDGRILRAVVYNKGAMVLHMLRRLVGDEVFFRGLRRFYDSYRFQKAGTDELRQVFEAESGRPLSRFFEEWIYGSDLPAVTVTSRVEDSGAGQVAVVRVEQAGRLFDFPLTVSLQLADGTQQEALLRVTERVVEQPVPFTGRLRGVVVNRDRAALLREGS
jgi:Peptidase family M1 domain